MKQTFIYKIAVILFTITLFTSCSKEDAIPDRIPVNGFESEPQVGGPNEPNQVFVNLNNNKNTEVVRDSWDLRFYCGNDFRVSLNTSIYMATKKLDTNDMNSVNTLNVSSFFNVVATATFDANNVEYVDDFDGDIQATAIDEISNTDSENNVYLVNLGYEVSTDTPQNGSTAVAGNTRGWKKIRILKQNNAYILQYADLDDVTFNEIQIPKDNHFNFKAFSFNTNEIIENEPLKNEWDLCYTVFTNEIEGFGTYGFTDFITTNNLQNVETYMIESTDTLNYDNFEINNIDFSLFNHSQRSIGSSWRNGGGPNSFPTVKSDIFYIIKDTEGYYYKLKFYKLTNITGERGYPAAVYKLLL